MVKLMLELPALTFWYLCELNILHHDTYFR